MGDLNRDEKVNLRDLIAMRKYIAKWNIEINEPSADCNGDGHINLSDLIMLRKHLVKIDVFYGVYDD